MMKMNNYINTLFLFVCILFVNVLSAREFLTAQVKPGDGIYSLLRRYNLDQNSCNFNQFYRLNNLKKNAALRTGRAYKIPIYIYTFNGETIRSTIGINDWDLAVGIQKYNENMVSKDLKEESYKKDKILWVPYHTLHCADSNIEVIPPVSDNPEAIANDINLATSNAGNRKYPIFGKKYAYTPLESNKLKGKVYYIIAGHGGPDPGAMSKRGKYDLCEDEYAYDVSLRLCRKLIANGATAYMINRDPDDGIRDTEYLKCDTDEVLWGNIKMSRSQKQRLHQRSEIVNDLYEKHKAQGVEEQRAIVVHVDSRSKRERTDLFFYHKSHSKAGKALAEQMHKTIKDKYKKYRKGGHYYGTVTARDLHMLREVKPLSIYIELANIRNTFDQQRIVLKNNRQYLADWLYEGLIK